MKFKVNDEYYISTDICYGCYKSGLWYANIIVYITFEAIKDLKEGILFNEKISKESGRPFYKHGKVVGRYYELIKSDKQ